MMRKLLIIDDDPQLVAFVIASLEPLGYSVDSRGDGQSGLDAALSGAYDMIVVDVVLPELRGFDLCRELRAKRPTLPIIMLSSQSDIVDKTLGLELGADDYVTKPVEIREFIARIEAIGRRYRAVASALSQRGPTLLTFGDMTIDQERMQVRRGATVIDLTATEFRLLEFLALNPGKPITRDEIRSEVWGYDSERYDQTVTTTLSRLRTKLEDDPLNPRFILTIRGVGYRFAEPAELEKK